MKAPLLNPLLTSLASRFMQGLPLAGSRIAPLFRTQLQAAAYYIYDTSNYTDVPTDIRRAPSAPFRRLTSKLSSDTFLCKDYGVEEPLDKAEIAMYASIFEADRSALQRAVRIVAVNHEIRVRTLARAVSQTASPSTKWNATSGTTIIADVQTAKNVIHAATGQDPNVMVLPRDTFNALTIAPELLELFKYTSGGKLSKDQLATIFGIDDIIVTGDLINNAAEGQTASLGGIWTDEAFLCIATPSNDLKALTWARTFNWTAMSGSGPNGISTFTYDQDEVDSRIVRARQYTDEKVIASGGAYYLSNVLS
jgi:hypothetical protein